MNKDDLKLRTKSFALRVMALLESLPKNREADIVAKQILRSATSVGANYRSACRARLKADFVSKITIVEEEADETLFWLELIKERKMIPENRLMELMKEADELVAIFVSSGKTVKSGMAKIKNQKSEIPN
ncbi:MAG: four helix bundle protein [Bacteroidota bacterium]|nr:four helix bundle protein [Bacteroidota bacterium]